MAEETTPVPTPAPAPAPTPAKKPFSFDNVKGIMALISTFVALVTAIWAAFVPIANYFEERRKTYEVKLSADMIKLVDQLESKEISKVNNTILLLSAYEMDAMPYLLYKFEGTQDSAFTNDDFMLNRREVITRAIQIIKAKHHVDKDALMTMVIQSAQLFFSTNNEKDITPEMKEVVYAYIKLLALLGYDEEDRINALFKEMESEVKKLDSTSSYYAGINKRLLQAKNILKHKGN